MVLETKAGTSENMDDAGRDKTISLMRLLLGDRVVSRFCGFDDSQSSGLMPADARKIHMARYLGVLLR
jgi:hypothetical protein